MHGAVFATAIVAVAIILIAGATPILIVPVFVIALGAFFILPMLFAAKDSAARPTGAGPSGRPTTSQAAYDPVGDAHRGPGA
jgi:hypothetical protein